MCVFPGDRTKEIKSGRHVHTRERFKRKGKGPINACFCIFKEANLNSKRSASTTNFFVFNFN